MKGTKLYSTGHNPMASSYGGAGNTFQASKRSQKFGASGVSFNPMASLAGASMGGTHQATVPMNFRGQDKNRDPALGFNPNVNVEDEYIGNLQQQIHFMELELKILKEKVVEDEKKSGIGSLFDDEKSSHQHISLLKQKYQKMKRDFDKRIEDLNKSKLSVVGEQLILDSQINIMLEYNQKSEKAQRLYEKETSKRLFELEKEVKEISRARFDMENDIKAQENEYLREQAENYNSKMYIIKDKTFDDVGNARFALEMSQQENLIKEKDLQILSFKDGRAKVKNQFEQNIDLQKSLQEEKDLKEQIEDAGVELEILKIRVAEMEKSSKKLNATKEELLEDRKIADQKNDEKKKELATKQEIEAKRLQAKLAKDKNVEVKELLAQEETCTEHNIELAHKVDEEKKKYDGLLDERLELDEKLKNIRENLDKVKEKIFQQEELIAKLKHALEQQSKITEDLSAQVEEAKKVNTEEQKRNRNLGQQNAALKAKLEFIKSKYDYTSNVNILNSDDFKSLMTSNDMVNHTVKDFVGRLENVKEEILRFDALKYNNF